MTNVHPIVHIDIPAGDLETAPAFYRDVFGWELNTFMPEYPMFSAEGGPGGGLVTAGAPGAGSLGGILLYLNTSDIDASLREVESHGGSTITPKTEIEGGHGSFAVFTDPSGNKLGLYTPPSGQ